MFRYLNQVPMRSESEYTAKSIFSARLAAILDLCKLDSLPHLGFNYTCICYVGDISGTYGEEINYVAICGGFTHLQPYMHWTIIVCMTLFGNVYVPVLVFVLICQIDLKLPHMLSGPIKCDLENSHRSE